MEEPSIGSGFPDVFSSIQSQSSSSTRASVWLGLRVLISSRSPFSVCMFVTYSFILLWTSSMGW